MANSGAGAIAEGIQAGWGMGLQSDELKLRQQQAAREDQRFGMQQALAQATALKARRDDLVATAQAARTAGQPIDPAWADEFNRVDQSYGALQARLGGMDGAAAPAPAQAAPAAPAGMAAPAVTSPAPPPRNLAARGMGTGPEADPAVADPVAVAKTPEQKHVAEVQQHVTDLSSRLQTGQITLDKVAPEDLAMMVTVATGRPPSQLAEARQGLADWQAGMETGNQGLIIKGINTLYQPQLQKGVGDPSPEGGHITRKEVIGLDPVPGDPTRVIPRLRVYTDIPGKDGQPLYYDAPMTQGRTTGADDPVKTIPVQGATDQMGRLGVLFSALDHPEIAKAAAQGEAAAKPQIDQYLKFNALTAAPDPVAAKEAVITKYQKQWGVDRDTAEERLTTLGYLPYHPMRGVAGTMDQARQMVENGEAKDITAALDMLQQHGLTKQPGRFSVDPATGKVVDNAVHPIGKNGNAVGASTAPPAVAGKTGKAGGAGVASIAPAGTPVAPGTVNPVTGSAVMPAPGRDGMIMGMTPAAITTLAFVHAEKGPAAAFSGMSRGKDSDALKKVIANRSVELMQRAGISPEEYASGTDAYKADFKSYALQQTRADAIDSSLTKIGSDLQTLHDAMAKGNLDLSPWLAKPINAIRAGMGSPEQGNYLLAIQQVANEYARLMVGGQLSNAQLHEGARKESEDILNGNMTVAQVQGKIETMEREMGNARSATANQLAVIHKRMSTLGNGGASAPAPAPGAAPAGKPVPTDADRAYAKAHPETAGKFKAHFGVEP